MGKKKPNLMSWPILGNFCCVVETFLRIKEVKKFNKKNNVFTKRLKKMSRNNLKKTQT